MRNSNDSNDVRVVETFLRGQCSHFLLGGVDGGFVKKSSLLRFREFDE